MYLIKLLRIYFNSWVWYLKCLMFLTRFDMLVFFTNLRIFRWGIWSYFPFFLVMTASVGFRLDEYPVNAGVPWGCINLPYYSSMTSLMMLSVILLYTLVALLSTLSVIKLLIYDTNLSCLLNLNLTNKTV